MLYEWTHNIRKKPIRELGALRSFGGEHAQWGMFAFQEMFHDGGDDSDDATRPIIRKGIGAGESTSWSLDTARQALIGRASRCTKMVVTYSAEFLGGPMRFGAIPPVRQHICTALPASVPPSFLHHTSRGEIVLAMRMSQRF